MGSGVCMQSCRYADVLKCEHADKQSFIYAHTQSPTQARQLSCKSTKGMVIMCL